MDAPRMPPGYELLEKLGEGGFGAVYKARQVELSRSVAIKLVTQAAALDVERFLREGQAVSRLRHPSIVQVYAVETLPGGLPFLVFEWVDGVTLQHALGAGTLPGARIVDLFRRLMEGLEHAHGQGVWHRDIKPANLLLPHDGGLKIADFGLARLHEERERLTKTGMVVGTPSYMSPEQATGAALDERTDLYSSGAVLYEMLAGTPPFVGENPIAVLTMHIETPAPPLRERVGGVPDDLVALAMDLLEKEPARRPQSATAVLERLAALPPGQFQVVRRARVRRTSTAVRLPGRITRSQTVATAAGGATVASAIDSDAGSRRGLVVGAACALALALALGAYAWRRTGAPRPSPTASAVAAAPARLEVTVLPPRHARVRWPASAPATEVVVHEPDPKAPQRRFAVSSTPGSALVTGLAPGGTYELEVPGSGSARATLVMPRPWPVRVYQHIADDHAIFLLRCARPNGERLAVSAYVDGPPWRKVWSDTVTSSERVRFVARNLLPGKLHVVRIEPAQSGRYVRDLPFETLPAGADERVRPLLALLRAGRSLSGDQGDTLTDEVGERTVGEVVAIMRDPKIELGETKLRWLSRAIGHQADPDRAGALARARDDAVGRAYPAALAWMQSPRFFGTLATWDKQAVASEMGALGELLRTPTAIGNDIGWGLVLSDPEKAVSHLASVPADATTAERMAVANGAVRLGVSDPKLVARVRAAIDDPDVAVARVAVRALEKLQSPEAQDAVAGVITRTDTRIRALRPALLRALAAGGRGEDAALARSHLTDPDPAVRAGAVYALAVLAEGTASPHLTDRLEKDGDARVVAAAAWGIARTPDARGRDALRRALVRLGDANAPGSRGRVPRALGLLGDAGALEGLAALARARPAQGRAYDQAEALWALGAMRHAAARPLCVAALESPHPHVRFRALEALAALAPDEAKTRLGQLRFADLREDAARMFARARDGTRTFHVDHAFPEPRAFETLPGDGIEAVAWGAWDRQPRPDKCLGAAGDTNVKEGFLDVFPGALTFRWRDDGPWYLLETRFPLSVRGSGFVALAADPGYEEAEAFEGVGFVTVRVQVLDRPILEP
jgi:tRNA A-37 threonylcarbamoyl transferase component Bud32/HEAT repeat protein